MADQGRVTALLIDCHLQHLARKISTRTPTADGEPGTRGASNSLGGVENLPPVQVTAERIIIFDDSDVIPPFEVRSFNERSDKGVRCPFGQQTPSFRCSY